ncbi:MAG: hypothetical protein LBN18_08865, partial [Dysgonamonadaceae bacterium]|nr:hypothetical protein [Dysgonamonadaceae bacterium]
MKIAVWIDQDYAPENGGGFSYYDRLIEAINVYAFDPSLEICFVSENSDLSAESFDKQILTLTYETKESVFDQLIFKLPFIGKRWKKRCHDQQAQRKNETYIRQLNEASVQLIYYPRQVQCVVWNFPFITTVWDWGHCSTFAFPEMVAGGELDARNQLYIRVLQRAFMIFTESEAGKQELLTYLPVYEKRIRV